jgi:MFS family permease
MRPISYKNYLLVVLLIISALNNVDRNALGIVLEDIKIDLSLSDTQLGLLSGIAFALFYAFMGIPIARWADRGNRVAIISITAAIWSVAVASCGFARNFIQLLLIRVGVAAGESGCLPPAHSLIAEYFDRSERPRAVARYMLHGPLAFVIGYFATGWLNQLYGWRMTFVILGLPGLVFAVLGWVTLKEPRADDAGQIAAVRPTMNHSSSADVPSFTHVCKVLWANVAFRHLMLCFSVWYFFGYGLLQWQPTFFVRSHGLATGEIGTWFALIYGVGGGLGMYLGGELASGYAASNERLQLVAGAIAFVAFGIVTAAAFVVPNYHVAFTALAIAAFGGCVAQGPMLATIQTLVPPRMRAMSIAIIYLFANLIGLGLGPLAAGALSDALQPFVGQESLRYALIGLCPGYFWAAWHLHRASQSVAGDIAETELQQRTELQALDADQVNSTGAQKYTEWGRA